MVDNEEGVEMRNITKLVVGLHVLMTAVITAGFIAAIASDRPNE
jgi:hypothetical protein